MDLPVMPPVRPMLAKAVHSVPREPGLVYEPKWDGFRCVVFRDGAELELGSRNDRPLTRYFPEVVELLAAGLPPRCVVDGEVVVVTPDGLSFDLLQLRLHPAASRVRELAVDTPAAFVAFDLLALDDRDLTATPFGERRRLLEDVLRDVPGLYLTPATDDPDQAQDWFTRFEGAGFDGVVAKRTDLPYEQDKRVMWKVKHERTADCVVAGYRPHKDGVGVGSLVLGLFDDAGALHHVGVASGFAAARRRELLDELAPYREDALVGHPWAGWAGLDPTTPGAQSRWNPTKELTWEPLRPELVAEVRYEHLRARRFRHPTRLVRFRADRTPRSCTYDQLEEVPPAELTDVFGVS
ncbi:ATP-dependent DNA ligase [Saccharothrix sp. HUAS TT1]|uniref:ATP-dependent DNA ligase n=1 Tax=unclassified Saccharothrix TaxID=2593673 RepID=UPI00345BFF39